MICAVNAVAPLAGAWIEINLRAAKLEYIGVAPLAGAWIEIDYGSGFWWNGTCRSPCGSVD